MIFCVDNRNDRREPRAPSRGERTPARAGKDGGQASTPIKFEEPASGATAGLVSSFAIAEADDGTQTGYIDSVESGEVSHQTDVIRKLGERWELLSALAQPIYETEKIIQRVME